MAYTATGTISSSSASASEDEGSESTETESTETESTETENTETENTETESTETEADVTTTTLTSATTLAATSSTSGYTVKLGCDGASMEVSSVKYNGTQLMPDNTKYALENLSFSGVNVSGLTDDTWTVEYTYTMTAVGTSNWNDYNFEISDGNTDGGLGYWSLRYDNYAVGWLSGYHEYGTWTLDHCDGVSETDAAYGGHWYGMTNTLAFDHSETLNKTLVMTVQKTASAFVITITSDGTQIWTCTNEAVSTN